MAAVTDSSLFSPFDDPKPIPALTLPKSASSNSETNPFRARNASNSNTPTTATFPTSPLPSPAPVKSKNPFLDLAQEGPQAATGGMKKSMPSMKLSQENGTGKDDKEGARKPSSSTTGVHRTPHPRPHRRPDDLTAPHRPPSSHPRRDPNRPPSRDKSDRQRDRRERPAENGSSSHRKSTRPRSNSESSIPAAAAGHRTRDIKDGHIHKPRSSRQKDDKKDDKKDGKSSKRRLHPVDKIDLLDVTGLYGAGFFHHDGPFDACRPHRNKHSAKAPVAAFPTDSVTNTLAGGLGEVPGLDRQQYFGLAPREAFEDYGHIGQDKQRRGLPPARRTSDPETAAIPRPTDDEYKLRPAPGVRSTSFDTRLKTEMVHGVESAGLGTSTFLEGAPAPKSAIEKAAAEEAEEGNGLVRKKSLVQKIKVRRATSADRAPPPPTLSGSLLAGANGDRGGGGLDGVYNPMFKEGQFIERVESSPAPSAAARERADSGGDDRGNPSGLLGRVKSLKISGGRKVSSK